MKILAISPLLPHYGGGAELSAFYLMERLSRLGFEVVCITSDYSIKPSFKVYKIPFLFTQLVRGRTPFREILYWLSQGDNWKVVKKVIDRERPDLIHIQHSYVGFKRDDVRRPILITIRDHWPLCIHRIAWNGRGPCYRCSLNNFIKCRFNYNYCPGGYFKLSSILFQLELAPILYTFIQEVYRYIRAKLEEVDQIIAVSRYMKEVLVDSLGLKPSHVDVIYHTFGLDTPRVDSYLEGNSRDRGLTLAFIGRLVFEKGIVNLLYAFKKALKYRRGLHLYIVGSGPLTSYIQHLINHLRVQGNVKYVGFLENPMATRFIREMVDVVVIPSLWPEPFGRVAFESMLLGKPVLVNPIGGLREIVIDGYNGFYANCQDINELASKILEVAAMEDKLEKVGRNAVDYVRKQLNEEDQLSRLIKLYEKLV